MDMTMTVSPKFWDKIADRYAKRPIADTSAYEKKLEMSRRYFHPNMEVLEFGCGTGGTALLHAPFVGHIRALDVSSRMIEIANANKVASGEDPNVTFEVGAIENLTLPDASVDAVLGLSILHLVEDLPLVLKKVHQMLKPGGVFISSTPCLGDHLKVLKYIEPIGRMLGLMPMVKVFTMDRLVSALEEAGFEIEERWQPGKNKALFLVARR